MIKSKSRVRFKTYSSVGRLGRAERLKTLMKSFPKKQANQMLDAFLYELCLSINTPRSLAVWILYKSGEFTQLVNMDIDPDIYGNATAFADDYLVTKVLSKYPDFSHEGLDPEGAADAAFEQYENACGSTNRKFRSLELDPSLWDPTMLSILQIARRKISSLLRTPNLESISRGFGWGPGANSATKGSYTSAYVKFKNRLDVTSNSLVIGRCCVNSTPSWVNCQLQTDEFPSIEASLHNDAFNIVRGNEIVFVPKNAKTHRSIAIEPHVNSYLQKGFGAEIRRLMRIWWGVDLNDQCLNQRLAKAGSLTGTLSTIDLKGASDTISYEIVRYLLPSSWFDLLDQVRSKQGLLKGNWIYYEKFSSMGNAFTFELESLIFYALCKSCVEFHGHVGVVSCYGDDLIIPTAAYDDVANVLQFAGFTINSDKSFKSGLFRESCGKDYFFGIDVRPIFLKESISNVQSLFKLVNSIRRYSHRRNFNYGCDLRFLPVYQCLYNWIPDYFRNFRVPETVGDTGVLSNFDEAVPTLSRPKGAWEGYLYKALVMLPTKKRMRDSHAAYVALLSVIGSEEPLLGSHDLRNSTYPKETRSHTHCWYDLGPWC